MEKIFCGKTGDYTTECGLCGRDDNCPYRQKLSVDWCQYHDTEITMQDCMLCPKYDDDGQCDYRG